MKERGFLRNYPLISLDIALFIFVLLDLLLIPLGIGKIIRANWLPALALLVFQYFCLSDYRIKRWKGMVILTVDFLLGGLFLNIFPDQILGGPMLASGLGVVVFAGIEKIFPFKKNQREKLLCFVNLFTLVYFLFFPSIHGIKSICEVTQQLKNQRQSEVRFVNTVNYTKAEVFFEDEINELTSKERVLNYYGFITFENGKNIGLIVSPHTGEIIVEKALKESPEIMFLMLK